MTTATLKTPKAPSTMLVWICISGEGVRTLCWIIVIRNQIIISPSLIHLANCGLHVNADNHFILQSNQKHAQEVNPCPAYVQASTTCQSAIYSDPTTTQAPSWWHFILSLHNLCLGPDLLSRVECLRSSLPAPVSLITVDLKHAWTLSKDQSLRQCSGQWWQRSFLVGQWHGMS